MKYIEKNARKKNKAAKKFRARKKPRRGTPQFVKVFIFSLKKKTSKNKIVGNDTIRKSVNIKTKPNSINQPAKNY